MEWDLLAGAICHLMPAPTPLLILTLTLALHPRRGHGGAAGVKAWVGVEVEVWGWVWVEAGVVASAGVALHPMGTTGGRTGEQDTPKKII